MTIHCKRFAQYRQTRYLLEQSPAGSQKHFPQSTGGTGNESVSKTQKNVGSKEENNISKALKVNYSTAQSNAPPPPPTKKKSFVSAFCNFAFQQCFFFLSTKNNLQSREFKLKVGIAILICILKNRRIQSDFCNSLQRFSNVMADVSFAAFSHTNKSYP